MKRDYFLGNTNKLSSTIVGGVLVLLFVMSTTKKVTAKDTTKVGTGVWANIGGGGGWFLGDDPGLHIGLNFNHLFKSRFFFGGELHHSGQVLGPTSMSVIGIGGGRAITAKYFLGSIFLAPGLMIGGNSDRKYTTLGLCSTLQIVAKPWSDLGFGIEFFSDINTFQSIAGFRLVIQLSNPTLN